MNILYKSPFKTRLTIFFVGILWITSLSSQNNIQPDSTLPENFPVISANTFINPSPGNLFIAPFGAWGMFTDTDPFISIIDNYGHPIYFKRIYHNHINDFKLQPNGSLTFAGGTGNKNYVMNEKMEVIDSLQPAPFWTDLHDVIIEDDRTFILGIDTRLIDMSAIIEGGQEDAVVMGHVVQEWDNEGNVIFEWNTWDHFNILDCQEWVDLTASIIDYAHVNTIEPDSDTSLLLLARNFNEITKIDRRSGEIIWRLGGVNNEFTFINDTLQWAWPHDIRKIGDGLFTLFDNGRFNTPEPHFSSGVIYEIDENAKTITQIQRFRNTPDVYGTIMGNFQLLDNGNHIAGWGSGSYPDSTAITEFDPDGNIVHQIAFNAINYRAWKHQWQPGLFTPQEDSIDFGELVSQTFLTKNITLQNHADYDVTLTGYHLRYGYFIVDSPFPLTLPAGGSSEITVKFEPDEAGQFEDALTLHADNEAKTERIGRQIYLKAEAQQGFSVGESRVNTVEIFPNPASKSTTVSLPNQTSGSYILTDFVGRKVKELQFAKVSKFNINLTDLPPGLYFIQIQTTENKTHKSKILIH